jgi:hypothetical protein
LAVRIVEELYRIAVLSRDEKVAAVPLDMGLK